MSRKQKTKLRVCLIGNSHSGCFKMGWDAISEYFDSVDIKFFPHHGQFYHSFKVDEPSKTLLMEDEFVRKNFEKLSGNDGIINFEHFDLCMIVGGMSLSTYINNRFHSKQVVAQIARDHFEGSHINVLFSKIRQISDIETLIVPAPNKAVRQKISGDRETHGDTIHQLMNNDVLKPNNARLALPPSEVWEPKSGCFKLKYAAGERVTGASLIPGNKQEIIDDLVHMNAAYGALFLKNILADLGIEPNKSLVMPNPDGHIPFLERKS